ncbi:MAG: methyltransferase [Planctomycetota bacterium]|nr:methyltransferase [Planctomycetota bacterium]
MNEQVPDDDVARLYEILTGRCRTQAVSAAAQLGVADALAAGPLSCAELADQLNCDADRLERLLLYLVSLDICTRDEITDTFNVTRLGQKLSSEALGPLASYLGSPEQWDPWARLADSLRLGAKDAFSETHGRDLYSYLSENAPAAIRFDNAIESFTRHQAAALTETLDLSGVSRLVDLGGGRGTILSALLKRWQALSGILVDLPEVLARTAKQIPDEIADRMDLIAGDFHKSIPQGADAYLLSHVLHNWDDQHATELLTRCAQAAVSNGYVFVLENLLLPGHLSHNGRHFDIEMMVITGGRERSKRAMRQLFNRAGLKLERTLAVTQSSWLLVGRPKSETPD